MSYLVLARKYRPQRFEEVVDQDHVTRTLTNAIEADRVAHALLFAGPRGTGKTTVARIMAKAMNCRKGPTATPCNACQSCQSITNSHAVDVYEIDGASNNSVDQVRELRENIKYMPAHSPYKIYIIDEVHMLSIAAFNALLKTLEEPPAHILFMFATTEPQKIPITILSRCQRHDFKRIGTQSLTQYMAQVAAQENVNIDQDSLWLIAREAAGGMRDALSLLDQLIAAEADAISSQQVLEILGIINRKAIFDTADAILKQDMLVLLSILEENYRRGWDLKKYYADLLEHFRNLLVVKLDSAVDDLIDNPSHEIELMKSQADPVSHTYLTQVFDLLFKQEVAVKLSQQPKLAIEMVFFRLFQIKPALPIDELIEKLDKLHAKLAATGSTDPFVSLPDSDVATQNTDQPLKKLTESIALEGIETVSPASEDVEKSAIESEMSLGNIWEKLLGQVAQKHPSLHASLATGELEKITGNRLEITLKGSDFNASLINRTKNQQALQQICQALFGKNMEIKVKRQAAATDQSVPEKKKQHEQLKQEALNHPLVQDSIEIFGGKVVDVKIR